ncbi:MAG: ATP-binding protein [Micrococcales bacterium]|nr:ATP-binding protein [Micrococcales bacterium]
MTVRTRLTVLSTALVAVALVIGAFSLTHAMWAQRTAALDRIVTDRVEQVSNLVAADRVPGALPVGEPGEVVQILDASGAVLASSPNASLTLPLLPVDELERLRADGDGRVTTSASGSYDGDVRAAVGTAVYRGEPVMIAASMPLGEVQGLVAALRVALFGVVPVLVGAFALVVWYLVGAVLAPVEQLRAAAAEVAHTGGPGALPVPRRADELHALARTLNEMLDRLDSSAARQRAFVADAAHELRTPLAALRTQVEVAATHPETTTVPELADDLHAEVLRLQRLTDDLLVLARVGARPHRPGPVDLAAVAAAVVAQVPPREGVRVEVTGQGQADADADDVTRVLRNLLENAVRHTASVVEITVRPGSVVVDDDGPGIPPEHRDRVFERFVRLDDDRHRDAGGAGLGLAIARDLARENTGDVLLSDAPTGGLRATVTLPASTPQDPHQAPDR